MLFSSNEIDEGGDQGEQRKHSLTIHVLTDQNNMAVKVIKAHALKYVCTAQPGRVSPSQLSLALNSMVLSKFGTRVN